MKNSGNKAKVTFLLSIDTEEEWDWSGPFPQDDCALDNINYLPKFHQFCQILKIRPTYFVDYAVANNPACQAILRALLSEQNCEIGAHLHPWCNPPYVGVTEEEQSHVINLPIDLVEAKLDALTEVINTQLGIAPQAFRTGRWGTNSPILKLLAQKGYRIDSSIYPYYSNKAFSCEDAHETPYWPSYNDPMRPGSQREIFEVPITAGFNRLPFRFWNIIHTALQSPPWNYIKPIGMLWHSRLLRKIYLSPELSDINDMIKLVDMAVASGHQQIHMFLHSSSLLPNAYCFEDQNNKPIFEGITAIVEHLTQHYDVTFATISEYSQQHLNQEAS